MLAKMADESLDSAAGSENDGDLPVAIESLNIDGTRPAVGDKVDVTVSGTISSIVDQTAFVTPEMVNDQPMPQQAEANPSDQLRASAMQADSQAY